MVEQKTAGGRAPSYPRIACRVCANCAHGIHHLDEIAAGLRAMASHAVAYGDEAVLWLAGEIERAADRSQLAADLEAALAALTALGQP